MATIHQIGPFRLDAETGIVFRNAEPLALGQRAVALLRVLVERAGAPVSKAALMDAAWSGLAVEESNLTAQIAALCRVFREEPGGERLIETLPRRGYRFSDRWSRQDPREEGTGGEAVDRCAAVREQAAIPSRIFRRWHGGGDNHGAVADRWLFVMYNSSFTYKGRAVDVNQVGRELGALRARRHRAAQGRQQSAHREPAHRASTGAHLWADR
jgi:DNA-binding winged helix-turn-helix (wHTH) protein